jgi:predicted ATPase
MRPDLPSGTVTFLFTDVEGSTRLLHELGAEAYAQALAEHRRVIRETCAAEGGAEVDTQGDAFFFAFPTAPGALSAAEAFTEALAAGPIRVRVGLHTGTPLVTEEGYVGDDVHRAARIAAAGHGGQVLVSTSTAQLVGEELRDLGEHRFKDLSAPERVYQLGEASFSPLKTLHQTNLPVPQTPFLGREKELAEVMSLIAREDVRLVTLTGPGGTGKTRLAAQAAGALADRFPHGVYWVPLATIREPELVLDSAAKAVGSANGFVSHVRDKKLLLLLDNFEQVVDAAEDVSSVLRECPNVEVLVTSRELLHLSGEHEYAVPPLVHEEGVGFFVARARAIRPELEVDDTVGEICRRLDDLPLALELAAARLKALSPGQILERLEQRLPLLTGGARDTPERQRTLRATIEWSYELLTSEEQRLFARLGVFVGGCTLEAAEAVCDADLDTLQSLVEKSLLRFTNERYWMLETIREYALDRLDASSATEDAAGRHARWYRDLSEEYEPELMGPGGARWILRIEAELANIRLAIDWGLANDPLLAFALVVNTSYFLTQTGRAREHARLLDETWLDDVPVELLKRGLKARVGAALEANDAPSLRLYSEQRLDLARKTGDVEQEAAALGMLATSAFLGGDLPAAARWYEEALVAARATGDDRLVASTLNNAGRFERDNDNPARSRELLEQSLALSRALGNEVDVAWTAKELAQTATLEGALGEARDFLVEGFEIAGRLGLAIVLGDLVLAVALFAARTDRPRDAALLFGAADAHDERLGYVHTPESTYWWSLHDEFVSALGESEFETLAIEGRKLDLDVAVARARALVDAAGTA